MNLHRRLGCGLWLIWLALIIFGGEWLLLSAAINHVSLGDVPAYVFGVIIITIIVGWIVTYVSVQRRSH